MMTKGSIVETYLDLLDAQREAAFAAVAGLSDDQIWQRPVPGEWCIGEILNHNCLNLILTLRLGIYRDQLHYDDVIEMAQAMTK